ncbi:mannose-1-phosphate guanyltransferase [Thalassobacter stenotrophicus]|uniref:mannose-1-phosphate guanylyltransferase/mannose-6-phosphate isomerase n=1 Tax=Thalassobacter stenotrophicus TaxID=266809 RepID=UPI00051F9B18|nr:mannose-1-phosphate guanylyltransferase/mannose-6-phosphate isomerase [Thalassobacter stenotrophicus]KGK78118.1 mannose-1-phosphate guanyltransferase [Thalassobacter stenotrophicus]
MITPILLCGGSGTRLWPLSRKSYPKQFVPLVGDETLFQASARRTHADGFAPPVVVTGSDFRFIVVEQLQQAGIDPGAVLIEPSARNTAPAVLAAVAHVRRQDPEALVLVAPADHVVPDAAAFRAAVQAGVPAAQLGQIVTFGITPDRPETGYGYLEAATAPADGQATPLTRFVEKPDAGSAAHMLAAGNFLWNAGLFLARADVLEATFTAHAPDVVAPVTAALDTAQTDLGFLRLDPEAWETAPDISIDYAVMERAPNLSVVPFSAGWSDLGGWEAVRIEMGTDDAGNATHGPATAIGCTGSLLRAESTSQTLVGIGLEDMVAVAMPDAVLVAPLARAQEVKQAVAALKAQKAPQATEFPKDHRPWGWFESLVIGDIFQVKRIHVNPGAQLSLQSHEHRSEHWIVVEGMAEVTIGGTIKQIPANESVFIPLGVKHRMANKTDAPMVLIEVQTGTYFGEDDIVRYEDIYARGQGAKG